MKKLVKYIVLYINIAFAVLLLFSYLSVYISPEKFWGMSFFGLLYPFLLIINVIFLIFWAVKKKKYFGISLIVILIGSGHLFKFIQLHPGSKKHQTEEQGIKFLSYNVRLFNYYKWLNDPAAQSRIFEFIKANNPDIICFQEFFVHNTDNFEENTLKKLLPGTWYPHINYTSIRNNLKFGIATFSRYPIINQETISFNNSVNSCISTDIEVDGKIIRVFNVHLQSVHLEKDNYNFIDSILMNYSNKHIGEMKKISYRLRDAYIMRAGQVDIIRNYLDQSPYPTILCGDFNDTPVSYTYRKLKGKMVDSFVESGKGIGNTYLGNFPSFRIDYIFHSENLSSSKFYTSKIKLSDHYPVSCTIYIDQ
ncbi:MAG: endonuclease/exonuclease/phosphatase family protein [Bacteroidales bacterium]|nr:endonuclease/exonuclease/phosphatase family protein [Bacteroidales bacterium]